MIGLPSTYRGGPQRPPPDTESDYDAYLRQMAASGLPSSTMPSAANSHATTGSHISPNHSIDQHQSAPTLDNAQYGVFEPQTQPGRPYSSFAPLLDRGRPQAQPHQQQQQQQVQGEFVPGTGAGTSDYYQSRVQRPHVQTQVRRDHGPIRAENSSRARYCSTTSRVEVQINLGTLTARHRPICRRRCGPGCCRVRRTPPRLVRSPHRLGMLMRQLATDTKTRLTIHRLGRMRSRRRNHIPRLGCRPRNTCHRRSRSSLRISTSIWEASSPRQVPPALRWG